MKVLRDPDEMRAWSVAERCAGRTVGLAPTMGALHGGHISLIDASARECDRTVVSIFVNPAQFAPHEDYDKYPRAFESDCRAAEEHGADVVYAPDAQRMYPGGYATYVQVEGLQDGLCGVTRPHFFRGVATVVTKLFNAVLPHRAYFGQKDGQQTAIIRRLARDLDTGIEIVVLPTVREADGLAMSSRNEYLTPDERGRARRISRGLFHGKRLMEDGERDATRVVAAAREVMDGVEVEYVELVDADDLDPVKTVSGKVMLTGAAKVGATRLVDNVLFEAEGD